MPSVEPADVHYAASPLCDIGAHMTRSDRTLVVALPEGSPSGFLADAIGRDAVALLPYGEDAAAPPDLATVELLVAGGAAGRQLAAATDRMPQLRVKSFHPASSTF